MELTPYQSLAERLNALPDGFPPTEDGAELRLLQFLYTPEEAQLAAQLRLTKETSNEIASRLEVDHKPTRERCPAKGSLPPEKLMAASALV